MAYSAVYVYNAALGSMINYWSVVEQLTVNVKTIDLPHS